MNKCRYCDKEIIPSWKFCNDCSWKAGVYCFDVDEKHAIKNVATGSSIIVDLGMTELELAKKRLEEKDEANIVLMKRIISMRDDIEHYKKRYNEAVDIVNMYYELSTTDKK